MSNQTNRNSAYITGLSDFIRQEYDLDVSSLSPASRGFYGETWRLEASGGSFFLKLVYFTAHQGVYERSFPVIEYLCDHGIDFISKIVKTARPARQVYVRLRRLYPARRHICARRSRCRCRCPCPM